MIDTKLIEEIQAWQKEQFPLATAESTSEHALLELVEAIEELTDLAFLQIQGHTLANTGPLCMGAAIGALYVMVDNLGGDLEVALRAKLAKNKARTWPSSPDESGCFQHIKEVCDAKASSDSEGKKPEAAGEGLQRDAGLPDQGIGLA